MKKRKQVVLLGWMAIIVSILGFILSIYSEIYSDFIWVGVTSLILGGILVTGFGKITPVDKDQSK